MRKKLGVCIVGCGWAGSTHAEGWQRLPDARVVAVVDVLEGRAAKLANLYGLETSYSDYTEAISLPEVDVVSVCVPTYLHPEVTIAAAEHGKHVLCEKPIALTIGDADAMIQAVQRNGVQLGIGLMRRHSPVTIDLRAALAAGTLGRPIMYHATDVREIRPKRAMHDVNANGGPVIDVAVHLLDMWAFIFNSVPVEASAQGLTLAIDRPEIAHLHEIAVDTFALVMRYASGDIGSLVVTWGLPPQVTPLPKPEQIYGPKGLGEVYFENTKQELRVMGEGGVWKSLSICHEHMHQREIAEFARCIQQDRPFSVGGEEGREALRSALATMEAIQTGHSVHL